MNSNHPEDRTDKRSKQKKVEDDVSGKASFYQDHSTGKSLFSDATDEMRRDKFNGPVSISGGWRFCRRGILYGKIGRHPGPRDAEYLINPAGFDTSEESEAQSLRRYFSSDRDERDLLDLRSFLCCVTEPLKHLNYRD